MSLAENITKDMVAAMKGREAERLIPLRMMMSAIKNKEIEKRSPLEDAETIQVLSTMIKQRHESIEQFNKGGRSELANKEAEEIKVIEAYLPKAAGAEEVESEVAQAIAQAGNVTIKDMGAVMKAAMARFQARNARVDGKMVSESVKRQLSGK